MTELCIRGSPNQMELVCWDNLLVASLFHLMLQVLVIPILKEHRKKYMCRKQHWEQVLLFREPNHKQVQALV